MAPVWGFWAQIAGMTWLAENGSVYSYAWQKTGEVLGAEVVAANETRNNTFTLSPDGDSLNLQIGGVAASLQPQADGSFTQR